MEKDKLKEYEEAALLANVPYLIHGKKHTHKEIEDELKSYGLDYKIDIAKTDDESAVLYNDKQVVHSVRGTATAIDLLSSDLALALSHPLATSLFMGGAAYNAARVAKGGLDKLAQSQGKWEGTIAKVDAKLQRAVKFRDTDYELLFTKALEEGLDSLTNSEYRRYSSYVDLESGAPSNRYLYPQLNRLNSINLMRYAENQVGFKEVLKAVGVNALKSSAGLTAAKITTNYFLNNRLRPEFEKNNLIDNDLAYANKEKLLVGHSLGGLVNLIGREKNIKTITFNPAPQTNKYSENILYNTFIGEEQKMPHPESKVYKTSKDPVSFFLGADDKEPVVVIDKENPIKFLDAHSLTNFLPKKQARSIRSVSMKAQPVLVDLPTSKLESYCRRFPTDKRCV